MAAGPVGPAVLVRRPSRRRGVWAFGLGAVLAIGCGHGGDRGTPADPALADLSRARVPAREIPLVFDDGIDPELLEFSSLAWWGDRLLLLPQHPERLGDGQRWYALDRHALAAFVDGVDVAPLRPYPIAFDDAGIAERVAGFDGYEALAVRRNRIVVAIETSAEERWGTVLVAGVLRPDSLSVRLYGSRWLELPGASGVPGFSDEALVVAGESIFTLHELNGRDVNPTPRAERLGFGLDPGPGASVPHVEYRITDATAVDSAGRFWVVNQFWPPEAGLVRPAADPLAAEDRPAGVGVERLVALRVEPDGITFDLEAGVVEIEPAADGAVRNWEGIVRWDDTGFLLVCDEHPRTILAYVPRR